MIELFRFIIWDLNSCTTKVSQTLIIHDTDNRSNTHQTMSCWRGVIQGGLLWFHHYLRPYRKVLILTIIKKITTHNNTLLAGWSHRRGKSSYNLNGGFIKDVFINWPSLHDLWRRCGECGNAWHDSNPFF